MNILIAATFEDHPHHLRARHFVEVVDRFYTCPTTQGGFLRFATRAGKDQAGNLLPPRLGMASAQNCLAALTATDGHVFLPDDLPYTAMPVRSLTGHRQWTDAYLLHLARHHGLIFASIDRRIASLDDPGVPVFVAIP